MIHGGVKSVFHIYKFIIVSFRHNFLQLQTCDYIFSSLILNFLSLLFCIFLVISFSPPCFFFCVSLFPFWSFLVLQFSSKIQWEPENCRIGKRLWSNTEVNLLHFWYKVNSFTSKVLNHLLREMGLFTLHYCLMFIYLKS